MPNFPAGKIVKDSDRFQVEGFICPEGYTAMRKFTSITGRVSSLKILLWFRVHFDFCNFVVVTFYVFYLPCFGYSDPSLCALYKMEVLRDAESKIQPLFRVTLDNGEQVRYAICSIRLKPDTFNFNFFMHLVFCFLELCALLFITMLQYWVVRIFSMCLN